MTRTSGDAFRVNLLRPRGMLALLRQGWLPYVFQAAALASIVVLIVNAWGVFPEDATAAKILRKTNTTTLAVWGLWWPALLVASVVLGRLWCTVCPVELVTNVTRRVTRRLGIEGVALPTWARAGAIIIALYMLLQLLVAGYSLHRNPGYTSWMLVGLLGLGLIVGVAFRDPRAFCKGFCPAALLLDAYSRFTPVHLTAKDTAVCDACETRECVAAELRDRWDCRSCPSRLQPYAREAGDGCVLCLQCAKVCPYDNMGFGVARPGFGPRVMRPLSIGAAIFVVIASGFVAHELSAEVKPFDEVFHAVPQQFSATLGLGFDWAEAVWFLLLLPLAVAALMWGATRIAKGTPTFAEWLAGAALVITPAVAAGHVTKAIVKMSSWSPFIPLSLAEPGGRATAARILSEAQAAPPALLPHAALAAVGILLMALGAGLALATIRRDTIPASRLSSTVGLSAVTALYCVVIVGLGVIGK
ncbi:MAG: 4Fe-4S binding protein [Armatimonadota bacterium]